MLNRSTGCLVFQHRVADRLSGNQENGEKSGQPGVAIPPTAKARFRACGEGQRQARRRPFASAQGKKVDAWKSKRPAAAGRPARGSGGGQAAT